MTIFLKNILLLIISMMVLHPVRGQDGSPPSPVANPPVLMEAVGGNRAMLYSQIVDKKLRRFPRLGFFSIAELQPVWGESQIDDYMLQGHFTYDVFAGINAELGFFLDPVDGIRPSTGLIYAFVNQDLLIIFNPRLDLAKSPKLDLMLLTEFRPKLSEQLNLYSRLQGLNSRNIGQHFHARSYIRARLGINIKDISFGIANNFDFYGPAQYFENNFGGFILLELF